MRTSFLGFPALALGLLGACNSDGDNPWPALGGGGTSGMPGNGGRPNDGGSSGAAERSDAGASSDDLGELRLAALCAVLASQRGTAELRQGVDALVAHAIAGARGEHGTYCTTPALHEDTGLPGFARSSRERSPTGY